MVRAELALTKVKLISPPHVKEKWCLPAQERRIYRLRWQIETVFQKLKQEFGQIKLNLRGKYSKNIKIAKFYLAVINYNFSTLRG